MIFKIHEMFSRLTREKTSSFNTTENKIKSNKHTQSRQKTLQDHRIVSTSSSLLFTRVATERQGVSTNTIINLAKSKRQYT